jgi:hypothetical protein
MNNVFPYNPQKKVDVFFFKKTIIVNLNRTHKFMKYLIWDLITKMLSSQIVRYFFKFP